MMHVDWTPFFTLQGKIHTHQRYLTAPIDSLIFILIFLIFFFLRIKINSLKRKMETLYQTHQNDVIFYGIIIIIIIIYVKDLLNI
jgi:hypothetical protein